MFTQASIIVALFAAAQMNELDVLYPDLLLTQASGPPDMCGLAAKATADLADLVRSTPRLKAVDMKSDRFELYVAADGLHEFVLARKTDATYPMVTCREFRHEGGQLVLERKMSCGGVRAACNQLFLDFRTMDSMLKGIPTDRTLSVP